MTDRTGEQFGHYRLINFLGHGGFADVYLGEHIYLGTQAAIKVMDARIAQEEIAHFLHEAQTIAQLNHRHIVHVLDFGVNPNDLPFLVMNYAPHGTLRQRFPRGTRTKPEMVIHYVKQIASGLHYAHTNKLIHRDIKPENILLDQYDDVLISDFGLAVITQSSSRNNVRDVSGTVAYMAPEQARGKPQLASDQYALGIIVYELLSGTRPFQGTYEEVIVQHALTHPPALHDHVPDLPAELETVIIRTLAKDPHQRFPSVLDFAQALEDAYRHTLPTTKEPSVSTSIATPGFTRHPQQLQPDATVEQLDTDSIYAIAWSPNKRRSASGGKDRTIVVRGVTTGTSTTIYHGHAGSITAIAWSPDGQYIASSALDRTIQVWHASSGKKVAQYAGHNGMIQTVVWSPDNQYIASTSITDSAIHIWYAMTGNEHFMYRGHSHGVRTLCWSPNGNGIASGSWREIQIWDVVTGQKHLTYRGHHSWVRTLDWSSQSTRIVSADEGNVIHIWEPFNKGHQLAEHHKHTDSIHTTLWSPDGLWIASADKGHGVHIWDATSTQHVINYHMRATGTYAITWLPDSKHIVSTDSSGSIQVRKIPIHTQQDNNS
ncbi:MAG TPA: serine/threonine-protein kinase [Dictyobacter sp.]|jgi:serine/threonine protein kinase|nr:serine/threonine-protein kinase [Dictyobacter sp.]